MITMVLILSGHKVICPSGVPKGHTLVFSVKLPKWEVAVLLCMPQLWQPIDLVVHMRVSFLRGNEQNWTSYLLLRGN